MKNQFSEHASRNNEAKLFLDKQCVSYTEDNNTGEITVYDYLDISFLGLNKLPDLSMVIATKGFDCSNNNLTSLKGSPKIVLGGFDCDCNKLISLVGAPETVEGNFFCDYNQLTSLEGAPQKVGKLFSCDNNELISLKGAPQSVGGGFYCKKNSVELEYSKPYDQYWIAPADIKPIKKKTDHKARMEKIADFRRFAKARRK